jgi:hypothetical protein
VLSTVDRGSTFSVILPGPAATGQAGNGKAGPGLPPLAGDIT